MTIAIYTAVTNGYDDPPLVGIREWLGTALDDVEYYDFRASVPNPRRVSYWFKYHPQQVLPDHITHSIWIDGNMTIVNPDFVAMCMEAVNRSPIGWAAWKHPSRDCIYDEVQAIIDMQLTKWPIGDLKRQVESYAMATPVPSYPAHQGLYALGCIARKHWGGQTDFLDPADTGGLSRTFDACVWAEMEKWNGSMDQVVVPYVEWASWSFDNLQIATFDAHELDGQWITLSAHAEHTRYDDGRLQRPIA